MDDLPSISILTPVFDRRKFLPLMIANIHLQKYPKHKIEWFILDSYGRKGEKCEPMLQPEEVESLSLQMGVKITYHFLKTPMGIGEKRNWMTKKCLYNICINMDSDDIYLDSYCSEIVLNLKGKVTIVGSPEMLFIFPDENYKMGYIRCEAYRQIHEGAMGYKKKHFRKMGGFNPSGTGEGAKMFDNCNESAFKKIDISKLMCCVSHPDNTCKKNQFKAHIQPSLKLHGSQFDILQKIMKIPYDPELVIVDNESGSD